MAQRYREAHEAPICLPAAVLDALLAGAYYGARLELARQVAALVAAAELAAALQHLDTALLASDRERNAALAVLLAWEGLADGVGALRRYTEGFNGFDVAYGAGTASGAAGLLARARTARVGLG